METENRNILFTLIYSGKECTVYTYKNQYYSLMTLISVHTGLPVFGLCSGMGSCGTCMVEIADSLGNFKKSLLSCDIQVNEDLANLILKIPI